MTERYKIISEVDARGRAWIRRVSDGLVIYAPVGWLRTTPYEGVFGAASRTKALRLKFRAWSTKNER